ncbi:MAG: hypothetical protein HY903_04930 [Deltaproteobacteria bacterium]|nr:hypothetical protein [Deltaproteobacteria bacterium]
MRRLGMLVLLTAALTAGCPGKRSPLTCGDSAECFEGYLCDLQVSHVCLKKCTAELLDVSGKLKLEGCLSAQHCDATAPANVGDVNEGMCRDGSSSHDGGDSDNGDGGDATPGDSSAD